MGVLRLKSMKNADVRHAPAVRPLSCRLVLCREGRRANYSSVMMGEEVSFLG